MRKLLLVLTATLTACVESPAPVTLTSSFNPAEVAWFSQPGSNTIKANAVLRTQGGDVKTCAGFTAHLTPVSTYANERFAKMYGGGDSGLLSARSGFQFASAMDPAYAAAGRETTCDSDGHFTFGNLPDGEYYVTARVTWTVYNGYFHEAQGGMLMRRVSIRGGETKDIVLTQ